jgi:hypothetical protein
MLPNIFTDGDAVKNCIKNLALSKLPVVDDCLFIPILLNTNAVGPINLIIHPKAGALTAKFVGIVPDVKEIVCGRVDGVKALLIIHPESFNVRCFVLNVTLLLESQTLIPYPESNSLSAVNTYITKVALDDCIDSELNCIVQLVPEFDMLSTAT